MLKQVSNQRFCDDLDEFFLCVFVPLRDRLTGQLTRTLIKVGDVRTQILPIHFLLGFSFRAEPPPPPSDFGIVPGLNNVGPRTQNQVNVIG